MPSVDPIWSLASYCLLPIFYLIFLSSTEFSEFFNRVVFRERVFNLDQV